MTFIRYVGPRCKDNLYTSALSSGNGTVIDTSRDIGNVSIHFRRYGRRDGPLQMGWLPVTRDLFDLGALIYTVDELAARPEEWIRRIDLHVPVADPHIWRSSQDRLSELLRFLTGDHFTFTWSESETMPLYSKHRIKLPVRGHDVVCLFSGGLDSLMGALRLLEKGRRVLLVGHHADGVASTAQRDLYQALRRRYGTAVELVQCSLSRSPRSTPRFPLPPKVEDSHRSRSFLFLTLGIAVARRTGIDELVLAENGQIALNPPLGRSRVNSLSTRTAHPRYLMDFDGFVRQIGAFDGRINNPFLYSSKTDIVADLQNWQVPLVKRSVSCAHATTSVRWAGRPGVLHCGYCVPCIYRRVALMNIGIDQCADYINDVFRELHMLSYARQEDMRMLVRFSRRVNAARGAELRSLVVSHGTFPAAVGRQIGPYEADDYTPWAEMLSRWTDDFLARLDERGTLETKRLLGL